MHGKSRPATRCAGLVAAMLVLACAPRVRTVDTDDAAFIYGFFDVPQKAGDAHCVSIIQDEKVGIAGRHGCMLTSAEGLFYIENVPPMRYNVHGFYVGDAFNSLADMAKPFTVKAGSMHYVGAFRYRKVSEPGIGRAGKFTLTPATRPTHADVLRKILAQPKLDPRWKSRILGRLRELGGAE